jgi:hypothetical protein
MKPDKGRVAEVTQPKSFESGHRVALGRGEHQLGLRDQQPSEISVRLFQAEDKSGVELAGSNGFHLLKRQHGMQFQLRVRLPAPESAKGVWHHSVPGKRLDESESQSSGSAKGQMALFTEDTHFVVYMNAKDPTPSQELHSHEALAPVFAELNKYDATTHFVGQSTILTLTGDRATGEAYCLAHHVTVESGKGRLMAASLRYLDTFVKMDGAWLFAERLLYVDWLEERALS